MLYRYYVVYIYISTRGPKQSDISTVPYATTDKLLTAVWVLHNAPHTHRMATARTRPTLIQVLLLLPAWCKSNWCTDFEGSPPDVRPGGIRSSALAPERRAHCVAC